MAEYILANTIRFGANVLKAGKRIDDRAYNVAQVQVAGGQLIALPNFVAEAQAAAIQGQQLRGDSPYFENRGAQEIEAGAAAGVEQVDYFVALAGQTVFVLSQAPADPADVEMHVNGIMYEQADEWSILGQTVTWNDSAFVLGAGDEVEIRYAI